MSPIITILGKAIDNLQKPMPVWSFIHKEEAMKLVFFFLSFLKEDKTEKLIGSRNLNSKNRFFFPFMGIKKVMYTPHENLCIIGELPW